MIAVRALLADAGVVIIKLFLHISKDEQRQRLQERLDEADKRKAKDPNAAKKLAEGGALPLRMESIALHRTADEASRKAIRAAWGASAFVIEARLA